MIHSRRFVSALDLLTLLALLGIALFPPLTATTTFLVSFFGLPSPNPGAGGGLGTLVAHVLAHSDSGGQLPAGAGLLRGLALLAGVIWLMRPRRPPPALRPVLWAGGAFLTLALASALASTQVPDALVSWGNLLAVYLCLLLAADLSREYRHLPVLHLGALALLVAVALVLPAAYVIRWLNPDPNAAMFGSFYQPNMLAGYLLLALPLTVALFFEAGQEDDPDRGPATVAGALMVLLAVALYLTYSRGAWLVGSALGALTLALLPARPWSQLVVRGLVALVGALGAFLGAYGALRGNLLLGVVGAGVAVAALGWVVVTLPGLRRRLPFLALLVLLGGAVGYGLTGSPGLTRHAVERAGHLASGGDTSAAARTEFWRASLRMAAEHPWLGVGLEGFHRYYPARQGDLRWFAKYTHSLFFGLLSETGMPATLLFLAAVLAGAWRGVQFLTRDSTRSGDLPFPDRTVRLGLLLGVAAFLAHSQIDVHWNFVALPMAMALAAGLALGSPPEDEPVDADEADSVRPAWSVRPGMLLQYAAAVALMVLLALNGRATQADYLASLAKVAAEGGDSPRAIALYTEATGANPWDGELYREMGLLLLERVYTGKASPEEHQALLEASARSAELDPHRAVARSLRGRSLEATGHWQEAEPWYRGALELDPVNYPSFYLDLARLEARRGNVDQARQDLEASLQRFPEEALGQMFNFRTEAVKDQLAEVYLNLALMTPRGDPRRLAWIEKSLALRENSLGTRFALAAEWFDLGLRLEAAGKDLEAAAQYRRSAAMFRELYAREPAHPPLRDFLKELERRGY